MLGFNETITVYNRLLDKSTGYDVYHQTTIDGCSWFSQHITGQDGKSFARQNVYKIRIPSDAKCNKKYVDLINYTDPETQYTLREDDKIIKGAGAPITRPDELEGRYASICTVKAVHDNRRIGLEHLYVEGT